MLNFVDVAPTCDLAHKDLSYASNVRETNDMQKLSSKLNDIAPFSSGNSLRNVVTGVTARVHVNVHDLYAVGKEARKQLVRSLEGQPVFNVSLK